MRERGSEHAARRDFHAGNDDSTPSIKDRRRQKVVSDVASPQSRPGAPPHALLMTSPEPPGRCPLVESAGIPWRRQTRVGDAPDDASPPRARKSDEGRPREKNPRENGEARARASRRGRVFPRQLLSEIGACAQKYLRSISRDAPSPEYAADAATRGGDRHGASRTRSRVPFPSSSKASRPPPSLPARRVVPRAARVTPRCCRRLAEWLATRCQLRANENRARPRTRN